MRSEKLIHSSSHGFDFEGTVVTETSLFDLASVTKLMVTTALCALAVKRGLFAFEQQASLILPSIKGSHTIYDLLAHRSGLPAWDPIFNLSIKDKETGCIFASRHLSLKPEERLLAFHRSREFVAKAVLSQAAVQPPGTRLYSDYGFIQLGLLLEEVFGNPLNVIAEAEIFAQLDLKRTQYFDLARPPHWEGHIVQTGSTRPRHPAPGQEGLYDIPAQPPRPDPGEVDDDNAYALGGVSGHAGLFSTAKEVAKYGQWLHNELNGNGPLQLHNEFNHMIKIDATTTGPARGLGFDRPTGPNSSVGHSFGRNGPKGAVGHLGFTGTSLWLDLDRGTTVAILTNRTYPSRGNLNGIQSLRPIVHDLANKM